LVIFFVVLKNSNKKKQGSGFFKEPDDQLFKPDIVRNNMDQIFVQLQEFSRDSLARMDSKIRLMNQMLQEVDQKTARLEALIKEYDKLASSKPPAQPAPQPLPQAAPPARDETEDIPPEQAKVVELASKGMSTAEISRQTGMDRGEVELILNLRGRA